MNYEVQHIPVAQIVAGNNDRTVFRQRPLQELAVSIRKDGLTNPITLVVGGYICSQCQSMSDGPGECHGRRLPQYRITAGERRFRAVSTILQWETIPAFVRDLDREREASIMLHENVGREDLNPIDEATAYQSRMGEFGWDAAETARRAGTTEANVRAKLQLLKLVPEARDLVARGIVPIGHAYEMATMPGSVQREGLKLLGKTAVPFVQFKQFLAQAESRTQGTFDFVALWADQVQRVAAHQQEMRAGTAVIVTSGEIPPPDGNRQDTAGDIIFRYMVKLCDAGLMSEAAAIGNLLELLLKLRKAKNFRENPDVQLPEQPGLGL